ncbi:phage-related protein [Lachnospiraceae bacterium PF1-21]|uniref:Type II toxin-antitoxin system RelE/ParE family toxin n=1 Tax=Ohessyouella blattaphilus TaxID=2949333 RepID=A0ABT1EKX2_9FIRM|nr:type II toxin-antitoxin system RelE/ParE family toxin [Ohessyouella blattaphilus]MCP1111352.1 type II toxin-antitoxin system RelE/ParE family toxin [Ohessyouella blattaphilus]MCR8564746.1 type II toxin-antitoxin system RelE/ParE family toxin [Ohessyouella blattaphilus]MDL2250722.1 type II toxin-antitoxin system RelE/ParE family toxin [Lachnospiraceae bacterium OttesenSCG-928-J05]
MRVVPYCSTSGKNLITKYIDSLTIDEQVDGFSVLKSLADGKYSELKIKTWEGKIKEVYFYKHNRIFYIIENGDTIYLLHACRKQKNQTEKKDAKVIRRRAKEIAQACKFRL